MIYKLNSLNTQGPSEKRPHSVVSPPFRINFPLTNSGVYVEFFLHSLSKELLLLLVQGLVSPYLEKFGLSCINWMSCTYEEANVLYTLTIQELNQPK